MKWIVLKLLPMLLAVLAVVSCAAWPGRRGRRGEPLGDLPLTIIPAKNADSDLMAIIISADGGWTQINRSIAAHLAERGVPVVGLNSRRYFSQRREPPEVARDLERIVAHYGTAWGRGRVILIGYSRGAGVMPFAARRLAPDVRRRVALIALLGLQPGIDFKIHLRDYLGERFEVNRYQVLPELRRLEGYRVICIHGQRETNTLCNLEPRLAKSLTLPGGHHFGGHYTAAASLILREAGARDKAGTEAEGVK